MAGLQRSAQTFRRSGSSGLVWDEKFLSEDPNQSNEKEDGEKEKPEFRELRHSRSVGSIAMLDRSREDGAKTALPAARARDGGKKDGKQPAAFRTADIPPAVDPPSPKVSGCILCSIFRKPSNEKPSKPRKH